MRRVLLPKLAVGEIELPPAQAHHLRDVLRLGSGEPIELFDGEGQSASGVIGDVRADRVTVRIELIHDAKITRTHLALAAAVPKGPRADWMVEKLSEIGVDVFVPLIAEHSVVLPKGAGKQERWMRLAAEAARQAGRSDVMHIEPPTYLKTILEHPPQGQLWALAPDAENTISEKIDSLPAMLTLLIGPEGGWSQAERRAFDAARLTTVRITNTILRVETAAIVAAGIVQSALTAADTAARIQPHHQRTSS